MGETHASPQRNQSRQSSSFTSPSKPGLFARIIHRHHKQRADHYIIRGTLLQQYYRDHDLHDGLKSDAGYALNEALFALKDAKKGFTRNQVTGAQLKRARTAVKQAIRQLHTVGDDHRTRLTEWMQDFFIPLFANTVQSLVYGGAGLLVMIVGLRGLGDLRGVGFLPQGSLDVDGMLQSWIVFAGLILELTMLLLLAVLYFFSADERTNTNSPEELTAFDESPSPKGTGPNLDGLTKEAFQALIERKVDEIRMIERIQKML